MVANWTKSGSSLTFIEQQATTMLSILQKGKLRYRKLTWQSSGKIGSMAPWCVFLTTMSCPNSCSPNVSALAICLFPATLGTKDNPRSAHGGCRSQPEQVEAHTQQKPGDKPPPRELVLRTVPGWLLSPARDTHHSHLSKHQPDLGWLERRGMPRAMTISLPGSRPTSHTLA